MNKLLGIFTIVYLGVLINWVQNETHAIKFKFHDVDPAFVNITDLFYTTFAKICPKKVPYEDTYYTIEFKDSPNPDEWIGICIPAINGYTIYIDRKFWKDNTNFSIRQELLYHELSHCVLGTVHSKDPGNYMYYSLRPNLQPGFLIKQTVKNMRDYCNE